MRPLDQMQTAGDVRRMDAAAEANARLAAVQQTVMARVKALGEAEAKSRCLTAGVAIPTRADASRLTTEQRIAAIEAVLTALA